MLLHHSNHVFYDVGSSEEINRVRFDVNENYMRCRTDAGVYLGFLTKWGRGGGSKLNVLMTCAGIPGLFFITMNHFSWQGEESRAHSLFQTYVLKR